MKYLFFAAFAYTLPALLLLILCAGPSWPYLAPLTIAALGAVLTSRKPLRTR
ncbi:MAG: hypothetical protein MUE49_14080 [Rhodospirillales bacterium]|jgi:hypothetical protein|nr:hypothetical protein [Rhodospirillales bacterium]